MVGFGFEDDVVVVMVGCVVEGFFVGFVVFLGVDGGVGCS